MLTIKHSRISIFLHSLLFLIVASSVLTYWPAAVDALNSPLSSGYYKDLTYISIVPTWLKLAKDVFALALLSFSLYFYPTNLKFNFKKNNSLSIAYILLIFIVSFAIFRSIDTNFNISVIFFSMRPFVITASIFIFCHRHLNNYYFIKVLEVINILAVFEVFYSCLQRINVVTFIGIPWLSSGISRSVGTFTEPNSLGLFLALCVYFNIYILNWHKWRLLLILLYVSGIFLSDSRTALLITIILIFEKSLYKLTENFQKKQDLAILNFIRFIVLPTLAVYTIFIVKNISSRGANSSISGGRLEIFLNYFKNTDILSILFGNHLGFGSNILQLLASTNPAENNYFLADSTWTYLLAQFGILGVFIFLIILYFISKINVCYFQINLKITNNFISQILGILIYLFCCFSTIIIFEFYAALPIFICLLFFIKNKFYSDVLYYIQCRSNKKIYLNSF